MRDSLTVTKYCLPDRRLGIKLALVADLHNRAYGDLIARLREEAPDAILVAGDTLERHRAGESEWTEERMEAWQTLPGRRPVSLRLARLVDRFAERGGVTEDREERGLAFLEEASAIAPVFLSVGNHEWYFLPGDLALFDRCGITLLDNADTEVVLRGVPIRIGGLSTRYDLEWLRNFSEKPGVRILMCHHPEYYRELIRGTPADTFDLIVGGHYHGGQWRLFRRGVYVPRHGLFLRGVRGRFGRLIVSAGVANTARLPRWGNPRELVIINL